MGGAGVSGDSGSGVVAVVVFTISFLTVYSFTSSIYVYFIVARFYMLHTIVWIRDIKR